MVMMMVRPMVMVVMVMFRVVMSHDEEYCGFRNRGQPLWAHPEATPQTVKWSELRHVPLWRLMSDNPIVDSGSAERQIQSETIWHIQKWKDAALNQIAKILRILDRRIQ